LNRGSRFKEEKPTADFLADNASESVLYLVEIKRENRMDLGKYMGGECGMDRGALGRLRLGGSGSLREYPLMR
jgi:hypothetical protein